ncbi:uncharacterized protein LOC103699768 [Phoenix dactylifera]|uniref:Uncharacterized protein LOC103699768 n=1 Tax=Phoenix dactylifera TaxID=42345 RepID=A0A8B8ZTA5_PHODC|nr:uncharacterized protein LOC103699768 [Phoenix dactylifera]
MSDEFSWRFESAQPNEIIQVLNESFGVPDDDKRYSTSCCIFNAKLKEGASVMDHVLYMIELIERLSKLAFFLHEQLEKDAILNSLPDSYRLFLTHYRMTKPVLNFHDLLGLLQNFEKDNQLKKGPVNVGLQVNKRFEDNERFLNVGDGRTVPVLALEDL